MLDFRSVCLFAAVLFVSAAAIAQEMPSRRLQGDAMPSFALRSTNFPAPPVALSPDVVKRVQAPPRDGDGRLRVGSLFDAPAQKSAAAWQALPAGGFVLHLSARSAGSQGLRTRLSVGGAATPLEIRVASAPLARAEMLPNVTSGEAWTPYTGGDTQLIEVFSPVPTAARVEIAQIGHYDIALLDAGAKAAAGTCSPDVACTSNDAAIDAGIAERKNSVALLNFFETTGNFICTGTLINSDLFPAAYMLTANHCISTQTVATSLTTIWNHERPTCNSTEAPSGLQVPGGALLAFSNYNVDSTLLLLHGTPPPGAVYAGWNAALVADNTPIVSISHPKGDQKKYAIGSIEGIGRVSGWPQDHYFVTFTRGVIEGGSSGSGLFTLANGSLQLRGVLTGTTINQPGGMSCTDTAESALYGRFEIFYPEIKNILSGTALPADDYGNTIATAGDLPVGGVVSGRIGYAGDIDMFRVVITQPGTLTVFSTGGNDLVGTLLNAQGSEIDANDDAQTSSNDFGITHQVSPGTYYVQIAHFDPAGLANYQIHTTFATATSNYTDIWYTAGEGGWGLALNQQGDVFGGALYTYDTDGSGLWLLWNGGTKQADGSYSGPLQRYTGPAFNTIPWPTGAVVPATVGTMRINFLDANTGELTYTVNGTSVSKIITRFEYDTLPKCTFTSFDRSIADNFQDIWWTPGEGGWGLNLVHQGKTIAGALYTFDQSGKALWLLMPGAAPQTTANGELYTGILQRYTGPPFNTMPWPASSAGTTVGNMSLIFSAGNKGTLTYSVNGVHVTKSIERFVFGNLPTVCN